MTQSTTERVRPTTRAGGRPKPPGARAGAATSGPSKTAATKTAAPKTAAPKTAAAKTAVRKTAAVTGAPARKAAGTTTPRGIKLPVFPVVPPPVPAPAPRRSRGGMVAVASLLVLAVGLVGLLLLNVSLERGAYVLRDQQKQRQVLIERRQGLAEQLESLQAPPNLHSAAIKLGMVDPPNPVFLRPGPHQEGQVLGRANPASARPTAATTAAPVAPAEPVSPVASATGSAGAASASSTDRPVAGNGVSAGASPRASARAVTASEPKVTTRTPNPSALPSARKAAAAMTSTPAAPHAGAR